MWGGDILMKNLFKTIGQFVLVILFIALVIWCIIGVLFAFLSPIFLDEISITTCIIFYGLIVIALCYALVTIRNTRRKVNEQI